MKKKRGPKRKLIPLSVPLKCCEFPQLHRKIGLWIGQPFKHYGKGGKLFVEICRETISVNSITFGKSVSLEEKNNQASKMITAIITDIDIVIKELEEHKHRLYFVRRRFIDEDKEENASS
jgi:hypothetical protein